MDWNTIINEALKLVCMIAISIVSVYVIPWIKAKEADLRAEAATTGREFVLDTIDKLVAGAEQIADANNYDCDWKKNYVVELLEKKLGVEVNEELDAYIESAVILLHNALK